MRFCLRKILAIALSIAVSPVLAQEQPAKVLFGSKPQAADMRPQAIGFYSRGCVAGARALPLDGPVWQVMRLSRNRRWGHPELLTVIEQLAYKAKQDGWNGLLVGDMSQPRGGPMLTGHASHQIGLDADLWFMPMPDERMSYKQREETSAISVLAKDSFYVDDRKWTKAHERLLFHAASFDKVQRILVHPGVKKKLCDTVRGDRKWLAKIRPYWGHHYHFHVRILCPDGSPGCKPQNAVGSDPQCDKLDIWFDNWLKPKPPPKTPPKKKPDLTLANLPAACRDVLEARATDPGKSLFGVRDTAFAAPRIDMPEFDAKAILGSKPIEASKAGASELGDEPDGAGDNQPVFEVPIPTPRPAL